MIDIIIIGAGPAGLTSAIYASRAGKKVLVFDAKGYGGQIINTPKIDNYPALPGVSGFDFATNLYNQVKDLGTEVKFEKVVDIIDNGNTKKVVTTTSEYECLAVIIATGADNRKLGLANEEELTGKGVSYCATCDGNFYKKKIVAVNGGGNTAIEDAIYLSNLASKVYLIHRREEFRADESLVKEAKKLENIEFILNSTIKSINGNEKLDSITIINKENEEKELVIDGLFVAIGQVPENENFKKVVELDEKGYIIAKEDCHTKTKGIFVAGDNRVKDLRQLVTATSDGAQAATEAIKYLSEIK